HELLRGAACGRIHRLGTREGDAAVLPLPPALATCAAVGDLADEVVLCEGAQVVARRAAGLPESLRERTRGLRTVLAQDVVHAYPQRVRQRTECTGVENPVVATVGLEGVRGGGLVIHGSRVAM